MKENIVLTEAVYYILLSLFKPMHGYGIMQNTMELSNNRVKLAPGTLYGALNTLLENGWITAVSSDDNSRKKDYVITDIGKEIVSNELERLKELVKNGDFIIGGEK
jgi:DNA-binding PadR family transcriptional regulator